MLTSPVFNSETQATQHARVVLRDAEQQDFGQWNPAASRLDQIDRVRCADVARERFGPHHMAERYVSVYRRGSVDVEPLAAPTAAAIEVLNLQPTVPTRQPSGR